MPASLPHRCETLCRFLLRQWPGPSVAETPEAAADHVLIKSFLSGLILEAIARVQNGPMRTLLLLAFLFVGSLPASAQRCSTFRTCAEAMESLRNGNKQIDGDRDGIPCERLCGGGASGGPSSGGAGASGFTTTPSMRTLMTPPASPPPRPRSTPQATTRTLTPPQPVSLVSVGDGDTIRVTTRSGLPLTIRLACIDTPEMAQGAPGEAARVAVAQMVRSGPLEIKPQTIDKYGRTVAEVFVGGRNVNVELVRGGYAFAYRKYLAQCDQEAYLAAEAWAQQYGQGVWRYGVERPWEFRQRRREGG
jgi:endonuclease YncB( thermonuclease family)